jgi:hypothetical protein
VGGERKRRDKVCSDRRTHGRLAERGKRAFLTRLIVCLVSKPSFLCSTPAVLVAVALSLSRTRTICYSYRRHPLHRGPETETRCVCVCKQGGRGPSSQSNYVIIVSTPPTHRAVNTTQLLSSTFTTSMAARKLQSTAGLLNPTKRPMFTCLRSGNRPNIKEGLGGR